MKESKLSDFTHNMLVEALDRIDAVHHSLEESDNKQKLSVACKVLLQVINSHE